jgi:hypothetical protein
VHCQKPSREGASGFAKASHNLFLLIFCFHMVVNHIHADEFIALGLEQADYKRWHWYKEKMNMLACPKCVRTSGLTSKLWPMATIALAVITQ